MWLRSRSLTAVSHIDRFDVMGTQATLELYGINGAAAADSIRSEMLRLGRLWSPVLAGNIVDNLRHAAGTQPVAVDSDTLELLALSIMVARRSAGAFDITVDPLMRLWRSCRQNATLPDPCELAARRDLVNINDLTVGPDNRVFLQRRGQGIDLGAVGKGFAADRCRELCESLGIRHALINLGGNVMAIGSRPDGTPWRIGIQHPRRMRGEIAGYVEAVGCPVVTSGDYERYFDCSDAAGTTLRLDHIVDPRKGWLPEAAQRPASVTVSGPSATICDALATAAFILGTEKGMELCESFGEYDSLFISTDETVTLSKGMRRRFRAV